MIIRVDYPTPTNNVFRITPDSVEEFKVTTSNATPEEGRNAGMSVSIATRSGTNEFHGSAIEYFRNTKLNSAEYFANAQGNPRPEVKANQYGFEVGGPIRKNQTFFFGSWQGQKVNLTGAIDKAFGKIPNVYTPEALAGIYRYVVVDPRNPLTVNGTRITQNSPALVSSNGQLAGGIRNCASPTDMNCIASYNIFANDPMRIGGDPMVLKTLGGYPAPNSYATGDGLNVAGYLWNTPAWIRGPRNLVRVDHTFNASNNIFFRAMWAEEQQLKGDFINSRPQVFPGYPPRSEVFRPAKNYAFSWRTVISPSLVNEFTAGFARFTFVFTQGAANPLYPNIPAFTFNNVDVDYQNTPTSQRTLNTPQFIDNLTYIRGAHVMKFGTNMRFYQQNNATGSAGGGSVAPAIFLSASTRPPGANFNLPAVGSLSGAGIASADNTRLLSSINDLLGIPAQIQQSFLGNLNTNSMLPSISDDGFSLWVVGIRAKQYNFFAQDEWKMRKNLTLTYGFRWEINTAPTATGDRVMVPDKPIDGSQGPVTFVKAGRYYDNNNIGAIGPRIGITWSPQSNTVVRAGYGIAFDPITTYQASAVANSVPGQNYTCTAAVGGTPTTGCPGVPDVRISQGFPNSLNPPTVQPSSFLSPPLQLSNRAPSTVVFDPKLRMQTVHQWNVTIQRELPGGFVAQAGYVGNRGLRLYSSFDVNQINADPILPSFLAMQSNLQKGCRPDGTTCPSGVAPSVVPLVASGTLTSAFVNSSTTVTDLQQNAAGNFAGRIEQTTLAAKLRPNQQFNSITYLSNSGDSSYHSLQMTLRKRFSSGLLMNVAYTLSKVMDVQSGDPVGVSYTGGLSTTSSPTDIRNIRRDRAAADFDRRHVLSATWIYELPVGKGKPFLSDAPGIIQGIAGGWSLQGLANYMTGEPFSVTSGVRTANYSSISRAVLVGSTLPDDSLKMKAGAVGPLYFENADAFAIPAAGDVGMGRNVFRSAGYFNMDGAIAKTFPITERTRLSFRMEAFNALNPANFRPLRQASVGSNQITSPNFGSACCQTQCTGTSTAIVANGESYRVVQFV